MHPRHRLAARCQTLGFRWVVVGLLHVGEHHRRLGLPVELEEDRTPVLDRLGELGRAHRRGAVEDRLHRRHVDGRVARVPLHRVQHHRDDHRGGDAVLLDEVEEAVGRERLHHVERTAGHQHRSHERERGVRQRRHDRDPERVGELPLGHLDPGHRRPHAVGHQHTFGPAGGAAGVHDRAQVLGLHVGRFERLRLEGVGQREVVVADVVRPEPEQHEVRVLGLQLAGALGEVGGVEHEAVDLGVTDAVRVVGQRPHRVQRRDDARVEQRRREVGEHLGPVLRQHGEARALRDASGPLRLQHLAGAAPDLRVRRHPAGEVQARGVVVLVQAADDDVREERLVVERPIRPGGGHAWDSSAETSDVSPWAQGVP